MLRNSNTASMKTPCNRFASTARTLALFIAGIALAVNGHSQSILTNGLIAYYPFNGDANDESGRANNGTVYGATLAQDRFGIPGKCYSFNGVDAYISAPHQSYLNLPGSQSTISIWASLNSIGPGAIFVGKDNGGSANDKWIFSYGPFPNSPVPGAYYVNFLVYFASNTGQWTAPAKFNPLLGAWHNYVMVKSNATYTIFLDGVVAGKSSGPASIPSGITANLTIGMAENGGWLDGSLDDLRIYNRALSAQEVAQLYQYESGPSFTINLTTFQQNTNKHSGSLTTTAAPKVVTYTTKDILNLLAFDENLKGNWPSNGFPASASLAVAGNGFLVVNGNDVLLDVSDIMSFSVGDNRIVSGTKSDITGLAKPTEKQLQIVRITFDDTAIIGGKDFKFYLQGFFNQSTTDASPVAGVYTETRAAKLSNGAGEGSLQDVPFVCTGTAASSGTFILSQ
jgi:hypothetical protein